MDFNTFLRRFGLNSTDYVNKELIPIEANGKLIYEVDEEIKKRICPHCNHQFMHIHCYTIANKRLGYSNNLLELLRVRRVRYKCPCCHKTRTFELTGIDRDDNITLELKRRVINEFYELQSFSSIGERYGLATSKIIDIFDEHTDVTPRLNLPEVMCIDEKHFEGDSDGKYCVVISNFYTGDVIDVLENRQMPYMDKYFEEIPKKERDNVKVFISDMYDGYYSIKEKYFPNAMFVVDLFHVIKLLTATIVKLRIRTYNQCAEEGTIERHFLKSNWKYFLCDERKLPSKAFNSTKFEMSLGYKEIILRCLKLNNSFWDGYCILQELYKYKNYDSYEDAKKHMDRIIGKLNSSGDELLEKIAKSYKKWSNGIIAGLAKSQTGRRYSNSIAENNNSHIQKMIDVAYGYGNFERFRKRILHYLSYNTKKSKR